MLFQLFLALFTAYQVNGFSGNNNHGLLYTADNMDKYDLQIMERNCQSSGKEAMFASNLKNAICSAYMSALRDRLLSDNQQN